MRSWPVLASLAVVAAFPSTSRADFKVKVDIKIPIDESHADSMDATDFQTPATTTNDEKRYFNLAHCVCDTSPDNKVQPKYFLARLSFETDPNPLPLDELFIWTGGSCNQPEPMRSDACTELAPITQAADLAPNGLDRFERVGDLIAPTGTCVPSTASTAYNVFTSPDGETTLNPVNSDTAGYTGKADLDMQAPAVPSTVTAVGIEGGLKVSWESIGTTTDYQYFQALCANEDGTEALESKSNTAQYDTVRSLCNLPLLQDEVKAATLANADSLPGTDGTPPGDILNLPESYICGQAVGTATSISVKGLENGKSYWVVLVAMDAAGNYTAEYVPRLISPVPVTDFWEDINDEDPNAQGGFCLIESTYGGGDGGINGALRAWRDDLRSTAIGRWFVNRYYQWGAPLAAAARASVIVRVLLAIALLPLVAIALLWHALTLPGLLAVIVALVLLRRRRRGRARKLSLALGAAIVLVPALASAQRATPYWDDQSEPETELRVPTSTWHLGLRIGPYTPSIDSKFESSPGPYERMYGGGRFTPMADLHYLWTTRIGQLGVGLSGGFFGKIANAYTPDGMTGDPDRERAVGNRVRFRVVPLELTGIYRINALDDNWGIPLVPYARGGLGYYVWWTRRPDGSISQACDAMGMNCDPGRGASLGLVGAVGLAIRAERVDTEAARSMRDSGIEHAGFYGELSTAWVDGFGNAKKLSLGDTTWSAGIDFEF